MTDENPQENLVWHYTYSENIKAILDAGVLLAPCRVMTAETSGMTDEEFAEAKTHRSFMADARLLLFSTRQDWEPASSRGLQDSTTGGITQLLHVEDYAVYGIQIFRIGVNRNILKPWVRLKQIVRMSREMADSAEKTARDCGSNPFDWWGSTLPVHADKWQAVQVLKGKEWVSVKESEAIYCSILRKEQR